MGYSFPGHRQCRRRTAQTLTVHFQSPMSHQLRLWSVRTIYCIKLEVDLTQKKSVTVWIHPDSGGGPPPFARV